MPNNNKRLPIVQPPFDSKILSLKYPLHGNNHGTLRRGYMRWAKPITGFNGLAYVDFLYNPSIVSASFSLSDASVGSILLFPNANDTADLRVPLSQTVQWTILYDRTYELWGSYNDNGTPKFAVGPDQNNPAVVGVLADLIQMEQFTGMTVGYTSGFTASHVSVNQGSLAGRQGILQLIPSYVFFGNHQNMSFYGYISSWDFTVTHWTQNMVPMRCVVDISWTMLPPPQNATSPGKPPGAIGFGGGPGIHPTQPNVITPVLNSGRSGR